MPRSPRRVDGPGAAIALPRSFVDLLKQLIQVVVRDTDDFALRPGEPLQALLPDRPDPVLSVHVPELSVHSDHQPKPSAEPPPQVPRRTAATVARSAVAAPLNVHQRDRRPCRHPIE